MSDFLTVKYQKWIMSSCVTWLVLSGAIAVQPQPDFYVSFDENLQGEQGNSTVYPKDSGDVSFIDGVSGQALLTGVSGEKVNSGYVGYPTDSLFSGSAGTVMFWVSPMVSNTEWPLPYYNLFYAYADSDDKGSDSQRVRMFLNRELQCKMHQKKGKDLVLRRLELEAFWMKGEWRHMAFSWNEKGETKLYVDGLPYQHGKINARIAGGWKQADLAVQDIRTLFLGSPVIAPRLSQGAMAFDELKIFKQVLTDKEVSVEYRQISPVDLVVKRRYLRAGEPERIELNVWPGGLLEIPRTGVEVSVPVSLEMDMEFLSADDRVIQKKKLSLHLTEKQTVLMDVDSLPEGSYRLACSFSFQGANCRKVFPIEVFQQKAAPAESRDAVKQGEVIFRLDCSQEENGYVAEGDVKVVQHPDLGAYREAGPNDGDRFAYEMTFPQADGNPVILEITWPDDRPRSMALYMYARSTKINHLRDRLSGGIQSGEEYPCSGSMQTASYIFYPWMKNYLFEARTQIDGYPAAIANITVRPVIGRLPKLPVLLPKGSLHRQFGHMDEDQTFEIMMNGELEQRSGGGKKYAVDVLETLLDYFDYTGQNALSYPFVRYNFVYQDLPGSYDGIGLHTKGWQQLMLDMFERRGKTLIATYNATGSLEDLLAPDQISSEYALHNRYGAVVETRKGVTVNPVHPEVRRRLLRHVQDVVSDAGKYPAFGGVDLWFIPERSLWSFGSLSVGYGDFTVNLFEQETGVYLGLDPEMAGFSEQRYQLLVGKYRTEWLQWRAQKIFELVREINDMLQRANPDLPLYLTLGGWGTKVTVSHADEENFDFRKLFYEEYGMDLEAMAALPSVRLTPLREPSWYRWEKHFTGAESTANELMWAPDKFEVFRKGGRAGSWSYLRYFESFKKSIKNSTYKSYFSNADVKPHGRYFLQELAQSLAATDAQTLLAGAQPMGMSGRDEQAREFAQAYRALPAEAFMDVEEAKDPVVVRTLQTSNGTYVYAVNLIPFDLTGVLSFKAPLGKVINLSSGELVSLSGGGFSIHLKPFELRSFWIDSEELPATWEVTISEQVTEWYRNKLDMIQHQLGELDESVASEYERIAQQIQDAIEKGKFAEAYRLIFSKRIRGLSKMVKQSQAGYLKKKDKMIRAGQYAVNCGSLDFTELGSGELFFPDQQYRVGGYGYDGGQKSAGRPVADLDRQDLAALYANEAYDIQAYRFTVPSGHYRVKFYLKHGYRPTAVVGNSSLTVMIEGTAVIQDLDVFSAAVCDFNQALVYEYSGIAVEDGVLDIEFSCVAEVSPTSRLCNAIEVVREN